MIPPPPRSTLFPYTTLFRSSNYQINHDIANVRREIISGCRQRTRKRSGLRRRQSVASRSEEHTSELQSRRDLVCRLLLEKKKLRIKENTEGGVVKGMAGYSP